MGFIVPAPSPGFSLLFVFEGFGNDPNAISLMCMVGFEASSSFFILEEEVCGRRYEDEDEVVVVVVVVVMGS